MRRVAEPSSMDAAVPYEMSDSLLGGLVMLPYTAVDMVNRISSDITSLDNRASRIGAWSRLVHFVAVHGPKTSGPRQQSGN